MAAQAVEQVIEQGQSLSNVLPPLQQKVSDKDKALLQDNSQYKIHNHKEIILFDYYQQLKYASPN